MIYTITLNPAIDVYFTVSKPLQKIEVNRADSQSIKAAGKGINCSFMLDTLKVPSTAIALLGGFSGAYIKSELEKAEHINVTEITIKTENRINMKLLQRDTSLCVNAAGKPIDQDVKKQLFDCIEQLTADDYVILSGSLIPGFLTADFVELCLLIKAKQAYLAVDTEMLTLALLKKIQPDIIKPNLYELSLLLKREVNEETLLQDIKELSKASRSLLVSLGADGAIYSDSKCMLRLSQKPIQAANTVGCGDAMLAGFIGEYQKSHSAAAALFNGGVCACAHAANHDDTLSHISSYRDFVTVSEIKR